MWKFSGLTWKDLGNRVLSDIQEDDVFGRSAQLAYYFLLALFPLLLFLISVIGLVLPSGTGLRHSLFNYLSQILLGGPFQLVDSTISEVTGARSCGQVTFGSLGSLLAASNAFGYVNIRLKLCHKVY